MDFLDNFHPQKVYGLDHYMLLWDKLIEFFDVKVPGNQPLENSLCDKYDLIGTIQTSTKLASLTREEERVKYFAVLFENLLKIHNYSKKQKFDKFQTLAFLNAFSYYLVETIAEKKPFRIIIRTFADILTKFSIEKPPQLKKVFSVAEIKGIMDYFVESILKYNKQIKSCFGTDKKMNIRTWKMFRRKNPLNLDLISGEEVDNLLDLPFLRKFVLEEGQIYFSDKEVFELFESGKVDELSAEEQSFVKKRYHELKREELIRKVIDAKLVKVKAEVDQRIQALKSEASLGN